MKRVSTEEGREKFQTQEKNANSSRKRKVSDAWNGTDSAYPVGALTVRRARHVDKMFEVPFSVDVP